MGRSKKVVKSSKAASEEERTWLVSMSSDGRLRTLVKRSHLPAKEVVNWWPAEGEAVPTPDTNEVLLLESFCRCGFRILISPFFRGLLDYYGLKAHHLNPNSISHICAFIQICEAFLGIPPHFAFFRFLFTLKPHPTRASPNLVGGAGF